MVATDGHRLMLAELPHPLSMEGDAPLMMHRKMVDHLVRIIPDGEYVEIEVDTRKRQPTAIRIKVGPWTLVARIDDEVSYPDYSQVIPEKFDREVTVEVKLLQRALNRILRLKKDGITASFNGQIELSADDPDLGSALAIVPYLEANDTEDLSIGINAKYISEALWPDSTVTIRLVAPKEGDEEYSSPMVFDFPTGGRRALVMPMRI